MGNVIDFHFNLSQQLGLPLDYCKDSRELIYELQLRFGDDIKDIVIDHDASVESTAIAQAVCGAILIEASAKLLDQDAESLYYRFIEGCNRGLFDLQPTEASPRLNAIYQMYRTEED